MVSQNPFPTFPKGMIWEYGNQLPTWPTLAAARVGDGSASTTSTSLRGLFPRAVSIDAEVPWTLRTLNHPICRKQFRRDDCFLSHQQLLQMFAIIRCQWSIDILILMTNLHQEMRASVAPSHGTF